MNSLLSRFFSRRLTFILAAVLAVGVVTASVVTVFAVHDEDFELEGNVLANGAGDPNPQNVDWTSIFTSAGTPVNPMPTNFFVATFIPDYNVKANGDFANADESTFTTGSKDTLNIGPLPDGTPAGWTCTEANNVLNQSDLVNAYAVAYFDPATNETKIYFAAERFGNNGTKNVGVWVMGDPMIDCDASMGTADFVGDHIDGDLFIVSEFATGGDDPNINVYRWQGGADGFLNPTPIASGGDCKTAPLGDTACATVNEPGTVGTMMGVIDNTPWLSFSNQPGNTASQDVQEYEFIEGGVVISDEEGEGACFARILFNTRSSDELGADIKDYALGNFELCGLKVDKQCAVDQGLNPVIDTDGESFITIFYVDIEKTGPGGLFDIMLEEDATFDTGDSCEITDIINCSGGTPPLPVMNFHDGSPVQVCNDIGTTGIMVEITCDTAANGFINSVTVRGSSSDGGASDFSASDTMLQSETCSAPTNPMLRVDKICHDESANHNTSAPDDQASHPADPAAVTLEYNGSFSGFRVPIFVEIENTGDVKLENISIGDATDSNNDVVTFQPVTIMNGTNSHTNTTFDGMLLPGEKAYFTGSYLASGPDGDQTDPCLAQFSDKVTVTAEDATGTSEDIEAFDTAQCPLCVCPQ
jgi:hypothetical protein